MNMKQFAEQFAQMKQSGVIVEIEFNTGVTDLEWYTEPGMRATLIDCTIERHKNDGDIVILLVNYERYDEYNKPFESHNYYDTGMHPVLTAREAGYYKAVDSLYTMEYDEVIKYFNVLSSSEVYETYRNKVNEKEIDVSYVQWLESLVRKQGTFEV